MKDIIEFFRRIPRPLYCTLLICFSIICVIPIVFSLIGRFRFTGIGEIGETIGGTMGPFVAILAAFLTFIAFWTQFEANQELKKENCRLSFETHFYRMIDLHLKNQSQFTTLSREIGVSVFYEWCLEIENMYNELYFAADLGDTLSSIVSQYKDDPDQYEFVNFLYQLKTSKEEIQRVLFEIAFTFFYYNGLPMNNEDSYDINHSNHIRRLAMCLHHVIDNGKISHANNEVLGHYYRHMFQIVKYIDNQANDLFLQEDWKDDYIKMLKSHLSDFEQQLLYYYSISSFGKEWREERFIQKYRLAENAPSCIPGLKTLMDK